VKLRFAVMAACVVACLAPSTVLAAANPNNHGHHYHYGWVNHHSPPPTPKPAPPPHPGGGGTTGVTNDFAGVPAAAVPQAPSVIPPTLPVFQPPSSITTTVAPLALAQNVWLVAILLAAAVAVNVVFAVWAAGRGGHVALRRALAPVGIRL
jgi:hypothetical protein